MRKRFEQYPELDFCPISEVMINTKTRHQLSPLLIGLQYIFTNKDISEQIFDLLEEKVTSGKKETGRPGMSLWEILVLGVVRLNLDIDIDFLLDQANNHNELRGILGVQTKNVFSDTAKVYKHQTVIDNLHLIDEDTLMEINTILVKSGHEMLKKKEGKDELDLVIKSDSYAVESNIHFPTDISLSWDSARKVLDNVEKVKELITLTGMRQSKRLRRKIKGENRHASNIHSKKGANYQERLTKAMIELTTSYGVLIEKTEVSINECNQSGIQKVVVLGLSLSHYLDYLKKFKDQLERRILKGEKIPHGEKVFSIFEPEVEWLQKGKQGNKVELGHNVLVTTDQYHLILDYKVMLNQKDNSQPIALSERLRKRYKEGYNLSSISFDRGFYSKLSKENLEKVFDTVVMPSKGKSSQATKEEEGKTEFKQLMNKHSAVESNINELEHSGVNKVPDKGVVGFKRYVSYGVLAYNLKRLGRIIQEEQKENAKQDKRFKRAA